MAQVIQPLKTEQKQTAPISASNAQVAPVDVQDAKTSNSGQAQNISTQDILNRASKLDSKSENINDVTIDDIKSQIKLDDIKDPVARQFAERRAKELEAGFNKKYEQVANLKKQLESQASQPKPLVWDDQTLDKALQDPQFISLVQARQSKTAPSTWEGSQDEWSALTTQEKAQFSEMNQRILSQESKMNQMLQSQEDERLKSSYPDYDPQAVNQIQSDLLSGRLTATREHLWKVANFDTAVQRAYRLGLEDKNGTLNEKFNASSSLETFNVNNSGEVPAEIKKQGFGAIGRWRLAQAKSGK